MDIIGIGYLGFETAKMDEWRDYGPNVMGFQIGNSPESDPNSLYFRTDDRRHRLAFHPGKSERLAYIGWEALGGSVPSSGQACAYRPRCWIRNTWQA
jgi:hypothetical protein